MNIDIISFVFGVIITLAFVVVAEHIYGRFFGNRKLRELSREIRRLQGVAAKKDELMKKALKAFKDQEERDARKDSKT